VRLLYSETQAVTTCSLLQIGFSVVTVRGNGLSRVQNAAQIESKFDRHAEFQCNPNSSSALIRAAPFGLPQPTWRS
jgi:hypothetical protein